MTNQHSSDGGWHFTNLGGLWDYQTSAVVSGGDRLDALSGHERARSLAALRDRVRAMARSLDDGWLVTTAYFMVEDLYKTVIYGFRWTPGVADYIAATAGVVTETLTQRNFVLHYVIDNMQGNADLGVVFTYLPAIFKAAGLFTTGPQLMALAVQEKIEGQPRSLAAIPSTLAEGEYLAERLVRRCHEERRSYVWLNMDTDDDTPALPLEVALSQTNTPGTIVIFRQDAPLPGSYAHIAPPPGVTLPR